MIVLHFHKFEVLKGSLQTNFLHCQVLALENSLNKKLQTYISKDGETYAIAKKRKEVMLILKCDCVNCRIGQIPFPPKK